MRLVYGMMLAASVTVGFAGCGTKTESLEGERLEDEHVSQDHSGWWCVEHGVPEGECALCDTSLVADFKAKGDWCDEHHRPESQCFKCDPERFTRFAARYEAKYGEQPPEPTE